MTTTFRGIMEFEMPINSDQHSDQISELRSYGVGRVYRRARKRRDGKVYEEQEWTLSFCVDGRERREPSGTKDYRKACKLLHERVTSAEDGAQSDLKLTFDKVMAGLEDDYELQEMDSALYVLRKCRLPHLKAFFGNQLARKVDDQALLRYQVTRKKEGAAAGTINRELSALHRAYVLAKRARRVAYAPAFQRLRENNARQGFFEWERVLEIQKHLPRFLHVFLEALYITGWRKTELLTRKWSDVDFGADALTLWIGQGKDRKTGRTFPLIKPLREALQRQRAYVTELNEALGLEIEWVFPQPNGKPIKSMKDAWTSAVSAAKTTGYVHDFRRTAVRNLELAGVPRKAAMAMVGHKTESIYNRYSIADQRMLEVGAEKLTKFLSEEVVRRKRGHLRAVK